MRDEQEHYERNYRDRDRYNPNYNRHPEHEQNAANRWGEPDPHMSPRHDEWRMFDEDRNRGNYRRDWQPFEQPGNRHFQEEGRRYDYRNEHHDRHPEQDHRRQNQHPDNRWNQDSHMPHQHHHPRHASERFYSEQRRRY